MTDQQKINEIISLMTFLQGFIKNNVDQSFTDLTFDLENLIKGFLNVFEKYGEKYENINKIKHNYPAIDLANKTKNIGLQVTTNANLTKVKKTISTYQKHNLSYSKLIVIGFVKSTTKHPPNVEVHGIEYLNNLVKHATENQLDAVYEIIKRKIPWSSLTPLSDKHCFDVVFDVINRSAVRDYTVCEGDFNKMSEGLYEVKEIITTGKVKNKNIRAKALSEYTEDIKNKLSEIEFHISEILQICNLNRNSRSSTFLCLTRDETDKIDHLKEQIILKTNKLAKQLNLNKSITGSRCY